MSQIESVSLIGVGLLGSAIAERLLAAGWPVHAYDVELSRRDWLESVGAVPCPTVKDAARASAVVLLSLPSGDISRKVVDEIADSLAVKSLVIDTTTAAADDTVANQRTLTSRGVRYLEATVAGSSAMMREGTASLFLGGEKDDFRDAEPLLSALAPKRFHLGEVGAAARFKLVHNMLLGLNRLAAAETIHFAESLGFDSQEAIRILMETPAHSGSLAVKGVKMAAQDYEPQAKLGQHLKDVQLMLAEANAIGAAAPLSELHATLLESAMELGFADADNSAVIEAIRKRAPRPEP